MDSEAKIILAFLFNRSGKTLLSEAELYLPLSMELGWLSSKESQQFVKYVLKKELLVRKEGMLSPNFSLDDIKIPVGFIPSKKTFSETSDDLKGRNCIEEIITQISEHVHQEKTKIAEEIKKEGKEKNLLAEVAALSVARKHGVDVSEWYPFVETIFFTENKG
ncbi:MAG TPA: DUF2240 family protein [Thermoplasmata archaeon]|jgi:hypothetical protein|nr:DUF2240 family protein [Thermoplasmata archaeon]